jgi:hypothetical protein
MDETATVLGPLSLARRLRRGPIAPIQLLRLLRRAQVEIAFRELVRRLLPHDEATIMGAGRDSPEREPHRVWAFCAAFERRYFPIYECDEIEQLVCCIPFLRLGWSYDAFHDLDFRLGTLLLRALCAEPYAGDLGARVPLFEAIENQGVPREVLVRLPADGRSPADLHAALDAGPHAAVAEFADWTWGQTDLAFLDCDDEMEVVDAEWSDENVQELTRQWRHAKALMDRVTALESWLELDPAGHFAQLVNTALTWSSSVQEGSAHAQQTPGESNDRHGGARLTLPAPAAA